MPNKNIRLLSWNVNGIRAIFKKGFQEWLTKDNPDILCLQETKAQPDQLEDQIMNCNGYKSYFFSAEKKDIPVLLFIHVSNHFLLKPDSMILLSIVKAAFLKLNLINLFFIMFIFRMAAGDLKE